MASRTQAQNRFIPWLVLALFLWIIFVVTGAQFRMSPTFDEQNHITRGIAILRTGDFRLSLHHPPLANILEGLPVAWQPNGFSTAMPAWNEPTRIWDAAHATIWERPADGIRLVRLARIPVLLFTLVMALVIFLWARELFGAWGGLFSLTLFALDPNMLAHSGQATTDMAAACTILLAMYALRRHLRAPTRGTLWLAGGAIGLALTAKFSGLILVPITGIVLLVAFLRSSQATWALSARWAALPGARRFGTAFGHWVLLGLIAGVVVWGVYGFHVEPLGSTPGTPMSSRASAVERLPVPAMQYLRGLKTVATGAEGHIGYLLGKTDTTGKGWWYYFPVAMAAKTPVTELLLILGILGLIAVPAGRRLLALPRGELLLLLTPVAVFLLAASGLFGFSLTLGIRHILPIYPFLLILAGGWTVLPFATRLYPAALGVMLALQLSTVLFAYPHFLAYFNEPAEVSGEGYRILNDSNYDWGQDLAALADIQRRKHLYPLKFSYFGTTPPEAYGIDYQPAAGFGLMSDAPAPSLKGRRQFLAVSVTNLVGGPAYTGVDYRPLLRYMPYEQAGKTILIYDLGLLVPKSSRSPRQLLRP